MIARLLPDLWQRYSTDTQNSSYYPIQFRKDKEDRDLWTTSHATHNLASCSLPPFQAAQTEIVTQEPASLVVILQQDPKQ